MNLNFYSIITSIKGDNGSVQVEAIFFSINKPGIRVKALNEDTGPESNRIKGLFMYECI